MEASIETLCHQLDGIRADALRLEKQLEAELADVHPKYEESARNLVHYIALRQSDIRDLQRALSGLGLSSLSTVESHVLASVGAVRQALAALGGPAADQPAGTGFAKSAELINEHVDDLLGANPDGRTVEIMVTLPTDAATDAAFVRDLLIAGMDVARINCAHDARSTWRAMIDNVREACVETGRDCRIIMDLAGPRVRTGVLMPGPGVLRIRPRRDALGRIVAPKRVRFIPEDTTWTGKKQTVVPVSSSLIETAEVGDEVRFRDTRRRKRRFIVVKKDDKGLVLEASKRAYLATGTKLSLHRADGSDTQHFRAGPLPPVELPLILSSGDVLVLDTGTTPGEPAVIDDEGAVVKPAHIACKPAEVLERVAVGAPVLINDGKIKGVVEEVSAGCLVVRITHAKPTGSRLRGNRSINFPGSDLALQGMTDTDRGDLDFVVENVDAVGISFVRTPKDVITAGQEILARTDRPFGLVPKIETEEAFRNLPKILLAAMRNYPAGIMIARGDLAVECGWERLAEIQEEILWLCEAAHVPAIWATQVLEGEAKKGLPSRAEITDAAMAQRADCVMLNKGPHILEAIRMLDDILRRMQDHQHRKRLTLRRLSITNL